MTARMTQTLGRVRALTKGFTPGQTGVIIVALLGLVLGAVFLTQWVAQPTWTPLFSNLSGTDANAIVEQLKSDNVQYQLSNGGSTILVPQAQVYDLRVSMSGKGLVNNGNSGYSVLDSQGMTATDLQQNVAYARGLEAELNKTLQSIDGVQTAIVHLAIPKKDVFASAQDKTTASVLLSLAAGTTLDRGQIRAVTHLVGASIPGLNPSDVTVTDGKGNLLSSQDSGADGSASVAADADQQTAQYEDRMSKAVQDMLDKVLGPGNAVVRVNAQLDYDTRATTSERYVSETNVPPLSEVTSTEAYVGAGNGNGGALGGTWPTLAPTAGSSNGGNYSRAQKTVDNPVGKVVESAQAAPGSVKRMTVAVVLNASNAKADPTTVQQLVGNAVGLDTTRGDTVQVSSMPFDTAAAAAAKKELAQATSAAQTSQYLDIAKKAGLILGAVIVGMMLLRRRKKGAPSIEAYASDLPSESMLLSGMPGQQIALPAGASTALGGRPEPIVDELEQDAALHRERLREEVAQLVENQPDEVAQVIQGWLSQRKG